jgi:oxaloacetate decarboxylase alpha subunit
MAGLLDPYVGFDLVSKLKEEIDIPLHLHSHATTGMSTTTAIKCIEAGLDNVDTSISSMSMTYGHSATETLVGILQGTQFDTNIDLDNLVPIATHFRQIRKKYSEFEGSLRGVDARIISSQVPGGMLTNLENQLREQNAIHKCS